MPSSETTSLLRAVARARLGKPRATKRACMRQPASPGPLVAVGRFYVAQTLVLALAASASAFLDSRNGQDPSFSVCALRLSLLFVSVCGSMLSLVLVGSLLRTHAHLLFSPTELSPEATMAILNSRGSTREEQESSVGRNVAEAGEHS